MSNIIKSEEAEGYASPLVFDFADVEHRAGALVAEAEVRAAAIIAEAERDAGELRAKALEEGREQGVQKGLEEGRADGAEKGRADAFEEARAELDTLSRSLQAAMEEFSMQKDNLFMLAEKDLLQLSLLIARKIIAREIEADRHVTVDNLKRCFEVLSVRKNVTVRVAPQVLDIVESALPELSRAAGALSSVKIEADEGVSPGGCLITAGQGTLDATIETQLAEVETILFGKCDE